MFGTETLLLTKRLVAKLEVGRAEDIKIFIGSDQDGQD